ncbi:hypothetical protein H0H93_015404, partial [Arthromyces matolae]
SSSLALGETPLRHNTLANNFTLSAGKPLTPFRNFGTTSEVPAHTVYIPGNMLWMYHE